MRARRCLQDQSDERLNLAFHYTCHTCHTEATGHGALSARSCCICFGPVLRQMGAWTSPRTFIHDPQLLIAKELGIEWLLRRCRVDYHYACALQIFRFFPKVRFYKGGISFVAHDMRVCEWVFNVSHATRTHCQIGKMIGS